MQTRGCFRKHILTSLIKAMIKARARHNLKYVDFEKIKNNPTVYAVTFTCNMYKLIKICPQQFSSHL